MNESDPRMLHSPSAQRNQDVILDVLTAELATLEPGLVLEVASGSGQHVVHFGRSMPSWQFQPSDPDGPSLTSIAAWVNAGALPNVCAPISLDVTKQPWPISAADIVFCANMIHISPWESTLALVAGASALLPEHGRLILYGPFLQHDVPTAPGNLTFDASLRARNPTWGIRALSEVATVANRHGFSPPRVVPMPANNLSVIFRKLAVPAA